MSDIVYISPIDGREMARRAMVSDAEIEAPKGVFQHFVLDHRGAERTIAERDAARRSRASATRC